MATTNFAKLTEQEILIWSRDLWKEARDNSYWTRFTGSKGNTPIHRFTELTKTKKGTKAIFQLVGDLSEDGVINDSQREGNEEAMVNQTQEVQIDLVTHSVRNEGQMADQSTVINFRETAKDKLAHWLSNRVDRLMFLTASGIGYNKMTDGRDAPTNSPFASLSFADDITAPSAKRSLMFDGTNLLTSNTASITNAYIPSYEMLTKLKAYAKTHYIKPIMSGGKEYYILLVRPETYAILKRDPDVKNALSGVDVKENPIFTGALGQIAGFVVHEHNYVYNTTGLGAGSKWGAGGNVEGTRTLVLGGQAMGVCDLGNPSWVEKKFDYDSKIGINVSKMFGIKKPVFKNLYEGTEEDFGIVTVDHFLPL